MVIRLKALNTAHRHQQRRSVATYSRQAGQPQLTNPSKNLNQHLRQSLKHTALDAVAKAMAMAQGIKTKRADEQKQKEVALEQQRQRQLAEQQKCEQAERERIEQARVDRARQLALENKQFLDDKKALYASVMAQLEQHTQKGVDPNSKTGKLILAISVADRAHAQLQSIHRQPRHHAETA